jgi:hypothetical protein
MIKFVHSKIKGDDFMNYIAINGNKIDDITILKTIENILENIIKTNIPHIFVESKFINNKILNKLKYDYSGKVKKATKKDIINIIKNYKYDFVLDWNELEVLISDIYINKFNLTNIPQYRKVWISYDYLLLERFLKWQTETFGEKYDLDFFIKDFLHSNNYKKFHKMILETIK